jgi:2-hydroxy-3-keto-5-methylthiopentenyl-1-phosphate phosphatase
MKLSPPVILACDFDGTITLEDVTNLIWDAHLPFDWRTVLLPAPGGPETTALEIIERGYREVRSPPAALLDEVRPRVHLRGGFEALVARCRTRGWPLHVISHGLDFYLRGLLPAGIPFSAFEGAFAGGRWRVALPAATALAAGEDFKVHVLEALRARHPGHATVYVGDGRLDFPAARHADHVFAVRGSPLATLCRREQVACREFEHFDEILAALPDPAAAAPR